ncbi:transposase [Candidatus Gottesmanbacteria bacterium]|nr:transposase [Candidatus Gottesmanbacteria bacterium]
MAKVHFKKTTDNSFFGNFLYSQVLPSNHFLVKLKEEIPWESFLPQLLPYYKGGGEYGQPAFDPLLVLKMLFLSYLYNLSERQAEEFANFNLPAKYFLGLGVDQRPPDHATLSVFKDRLLKGGGVLPYEQMFTKIIKIAVDKKIAFGDIQIIDSSHTPANVNAFKDKERKENEGKPPRDPDARWGVKHLREATTKEGKKVRIKNQFYGFKSHTSLNNQNLLTTSIKVSGGEAYDGEFLPSLVKKDQAKKLKPKTYSTDKGYDDGNNHDFLREKGLKTAICLNNNRTTSKSEENNSYWQKIKDDPDYQKGQDERYKIERSYADAKVKHGLKRCRYLGLAKFTIQSYLTFAAMNLKRIIKLTTNISFKNENYQYSYCYS